VAAAGLFLGLVVLWLRVGWLQVVAHGHFEARADRNQEQRVLLKPGRGHLLDRHGRVLARDLPTYSISAAPREMKNPRRTARQLARILDIDPRKLERSFAAKPRFLWVARRVAPVLGVGDVHLELAGEGAQQDVARLRGRGGRRRVDDHERAHVVQANQR